MIAESGRIRRGAMSRRWAMWSRVVHSSRTAARPRRSRTLWIPDVRRQRSRRGRRGLSASRGPQIVEFLCGPIGFALLRQDRRDRRAQFDEHFHVERRVVEPVRGQRALGPVGRAMALDQPQTQQPLDHGRQVHPVESGQPPGSSVSYSAGGRMPTSARQGRS